jgi:hypothetical protein
MAFFYQNRTGMGQGIMPGMPQQPQMPARPQYNPTPWEASGPIKAPWEMALLAAGANLVAGKGIGGGILGGLEGYLSERSYQDAQRRQAEQDQYRRHRDEVTDYKDDRTYKTDEYRDTRDYATGREDEGRRRMETDRTFEAGRDDERFNRMDRNRVFSEGQRQFGLNYNRGILESDRNYGLSRDQYQRGILESDRSHALSTDAARRAQANDDWQRSQDIVRGNIDAGKSARAARESDASIEYTRALTEKARRPEVSSGSVLEVTPNDTLAFEDDAAAMLGVETLDDAGISPAARSAGAQAYGREYQATRNHAAAVEAGMRAMNAPVGSSVESQGGIFGFGGTPTVVPPKGVLPPQQDVLGTAGAATGEGAVEARKVMNGKTYVKIGGQWFEE